MCDFSCIWECDPKQIYRSERIQTISSPILETKATTKMGGTCQPRSITRSVTEV